MVDDIRILSNQLIDFLKEYPNRPWKPANNRAEEVVTLSCTEAYIRFAGDVSHRDVVPIERFIEVNNIVLAGRAKFRGQPTLPAAD